jgi:uncharacterized membrane protein
MDLALLRSAASSPGADQHRLAAATAAVLGIAAVDTYCGTQLTSKHDASPRETLHTSEVRVKSTITINAPIDQVYAERDGFQSLPRFMKDLASVEVTSGRHMHWRATLPGGLSAGWDVEITNATPSKPIQWKTADSSGLVASGQVEFRTAPGDRSTEM